jgi:hypothetical protein
MFSSPVAVEFLVAAVFATFEVEHHLDEFGFNFGIRHVGVNI